MYRVIMKNIDGAGQNDLLADEFPTVDTAIAAGRKIWQEVNISETVQLGTFIESSGGWYVAIDDDLVSMVIVFRDGFLAP